MRRVFTVASNRCQVGEQVGEVSGESGGEEDDANKPKTIDDVLMIIEKINGKLEVIDNFRVSSDSRVGDLGERI